MKIGVDKSGIEKEWKPLSWQERSNQAGVGVGDPC